MADLKGSTATAITAVSDTTRFLVSNGGADGVATGNQIPVYMGNKVRKANTAIQSITAATLTKINGSDLLVPTDSQIAVGTVFQWQVLATKTAAGTAARTFHVRLGTAGTTADTAIATFTSAAGTAAVDAAYIEILAICISITSNVATFECSFSLSHNLASTGFATTGNQIVSPAGSTATLNISTASLIATLSVTSGSLEAITVRQVFAQAFNI